MVFSQGVYMVTTAASGVEQGGQAVVVDVTAYAFDVDDAGIAVPMIERSFSTNRSSLTAPAGRGALGKSRPSRSPRPACRIPSPFQARNIGCEYEVPGQQHSRSSSDCIVRRRFRLDHSQRLCAEHGLVRGYRPREKRRSGDVYRSRSVGTTTPDDHSRQGDGHDGSGAPCPCCA